MPTMRSESTILDGENPFDVALDHYERSHPPDYGDFFWSETHFWSVWAPDDGVGIYVHVGTTPEDADLWWAQVCAYLPNGMVLQDRSWGRSPERRGPDTGNFRSRSSSLGHFHLSFDGAGEYLTIDDQVSRVVGAGPALPFRFEVDLAPAMPVWDLFKAVPIPGERDLGGQHHEQVHRAQGWLEVPGEHGGRWRLDGASFRDHSIGHRDFSPLGGDHLHGLLFPDSGRAVQTLFMWNTSGEVEIRAASIWEDGKLELIGDVEMTGVEEGAAPPRSVTSLRGAPREFELRMMRANGDEVVIAQQVEHVLLQSNTSPNTNLNGAAVDYGADALILVESQLRADWNGDIGHGHLERGYRANLLPEGAFD